MPWSIDRSERIDGRYKLRNGVLHKQAVDTGIWYGYWISQLS
ncbi:hypothetical protein [Alcaligenes faecalis]|nr:hypothetical protein [Alcaligenes faecalis]